jgi:transcriptional regulator with XRE-family HTH domain
VSVASRKRLLAELKNKQYRDAYAAEHVKTMMPIQNRILREQRGWSQGQLAERRKTTQSVISRLEDPNYGKLSLSSLLKLASAYDVALLVKFVPFSRLLHEFEDTSPQALSAKEFMEELPQLAAWADETHETNIVRPEPMRTSLVLTYGSVGPHQLWDRPVKLPAPGESFELNFPRPGPLVARDDTRNLSLSTPQPLQEVS